MEKNNLLESKKETCVIDLTSDDDENLKASTSKSNKCQIKKRKISVNGVPLIIHNKKMRYKYIRVPLNNVVEKIKIKKKDVPKTLCNEEITVLYSKHDKVEKENILTSLATILKVSNDTVLPKNVNTKDNNVLYSKCNKTNEEIDLVSPAKNLDNKDINIDTSFVKPNVISQNNTPTVLPTNLDTEVTKDIIDKNFNVPEDKLNQEMENTVKENEILMQNHVSNTQLIGNNPEKENTNTYCSNYINICLLTNQIANRENVCRFYWWDAYENPLERNIYFFGKVYIDSNKTTYSSCLTIKNIPRKIYLLPTKYLKNSLIGNTKETTKEDVYNEFNKLANNLGISEFKSRWVNKKYIFQKDILDNEECLEIIYPAMNQSINFNYTGPAIEQIVEISLSPLKSLLLESNIKGPCWLNIKDPMSDLSYPSWCRINIICKSIENISVSDLSLSKSLPLPPMIVATINICTYLDDKTKQDKILMVVILLKHEYPFVEDAPNQLFKQTFCLITKPNGTQWPLEVDQVLSNVTNIDIIKCENETALLEQLMYILEKTDPDLYVGYDSNSQLEFLLRRMITLNITNWHKIGKIKSYASFGPKDKIYMDQVVPGRPVCDLRYLSLELNIKSNNLQSLSEQVLKKKYNQNEEIKRDNYISYYSSEKHLKDFIEFTVANTWDISLISLKLDVISFVIELTRISGYYLSKLLQNGQIQRNEFLLSHAFYANNYLLPDFREKTQEIGIKKTNYEGGLVLDPRRGFYDKLVLLMDFTSLYPSIIIEYNLCLSTIPGATTCIDYQELKIPESNSELGIIPKEMYKLIKYRKQLKELMKSPCISSSLKMQYNTKQLALKLMANSLYGCLGAPSCRFYAKGLAALITSKGRKILSNTKSLIESMKHQVIYGDTDSVMIKTDVLDYDKVISIGNKIKEEVNKSFKHIKLSIDSVFRYLLLIQKKKYAALEMNKLPNGQIELSLIYKGLLIARRDWCPLSVQIGKDILHIILSDASIQTKNNSIHELFKNISKMIRENNIPVSSFLISKNLSRNLNNYQDNNQLHIQVARRLNERSGRIWKVGDTVSYVICKDESNVQKSYDINEFKEDKSLKIDINYYLTKQFLPVLSTICEPIMKIDKKLMENLVKEEIETETSKNIEGKTVTQGELNHCKAFTFKCRNCKTDITITNILSNSSNDCQLFLQTTCSNDKCKTPLWKNARTIADELQLSIKKAIDMYDLSGFKCENPKCNYETKWPPLDSSTKLECKICKKSYLSRKYTKLNLQDQINFYRDIFDLSKLQNESLVNTCSQEVISTYNMLKDNVNKYVEIYSNSIVSLDQLFRYKFKKHSENNIDFNISFNDYIHAEDDK